MDAANLIQLGVCFLVITTVGFMRAWQRSRAKVSSLEKQLALLECHKPTILDGQEWHEHLDKDGEPFMYIRRDQDVQDN